MVTRKTQPDAAGGRLTGDLLEDLHVANSLPTLFNRDKSPTQILSDIENCLILEPSRIAEMLVELASASTLGGIDQLGDYKAGKTSRERDELFEACKQILRSANPDSFTYQNIIYKINDMLVI